MDVSNRPGFERSFFSFLRRFFLGIASISESEKENSAVSEPEKSPERKRRIRKLKAYDPICRYANRSTPLVKREPFYCNFTVA